MLNLKNSVSSFGEAHRHLWCDRVNILFTLAPIILGVILYYYTGRSVYSWTMEWGQGIIDSYVTSSSFADVLGWLMMAILTVALFFLINWTFVMVVTLIASPFNDLISERIEKKLTGKEAPGLGDSIGQMVKNIGKTLFNEVKKILVIGFFTLLAILLSFFPLLVPISLVLTAILFATQFSDYSWSRHNLGVRQCFDDVKKNVLTYTVIGGFFLLIVSIPIFNLFVPSWATSYFTILWTKGQHE